MFKDGDVVIVVTNMISNGNSAQVPWSFFSPLPAVCKVIRASNHSIAVERVDGYHPKIQSVKFEQLGCLEPIKNEEII